MQKNQILRILNPFLALLLAFQLASGLLPALVPYTLHRAAGILLAAGIGLHLYLNGQWIRANIFKR